MSLIGVFWYNIGDMDNKFLESEIDRKMNAALQEERRHRVEKERRRRKKRMRSRIITIFLAAAAVCVLCFVLANIFSSDVYNDEEEFKAFADKAIMQNEVYSLDNGTTEYSYSKELSTAVKINETDNDYLRFQRDKKIKETIGSVTADIKKNNDNTPTALLIDSGVFDSGNGARSLYIQYMVFIEQDKDMVLQEAKADTYLFNSKDLKGIDNLQALNVNYKDKASEYINESLKREFNKDDLIEYYQDYTAPEDRNLNDFVMTGKDVVFVFEQHTVLAEGKGVAKVRVPYTVLESCIRPKVLDRYIDPSKPMVAITYDDGPGGDSEKRILNILAENGSVATFFYLGNRVENFKKNAVRAAEIGCEIGNHSWDHPEMTKLSKKEITKEIDRTNKVIKEVCGVEPVVARPPYGDFNKSVLKAAGMAEIMWTIDTLDWKTRDPKQTFKAVKNTKHLDGKIILMHSIYDETADATKKIVPWLKKNGYQTVTISELIKYKTGKTPKPGKLYMKF